jgi:peroxiredoxin
VAALGSVTGEPIIIDDEHALVAIGVAAASRTDALASLDAPDIVVDTLDGQPFALADLRGTKSLLVAFASWCGCRYDLPVWQELHDELAPSGFGVVAVAVDESADDVHEWVEGISIPVLLDRDRVFTEAFDLRNVPLTIWLDEDNRIVRPNDVAFGSDTFIDFHGIDSTPHLDALRRWVLDGELPLAPDQVRDNLPSTNDDVQLARTHFRLAVELRRRGATEAASRHFTAADALAPFDFTIRRAAMPLQGIDPMVSEEFFALFGDFEAAGKPDYGFSGGAPVGAGSAAGDAPQPDGMA